VVCYIKMIYSIRYTLNAIIVLRSSSEKTSKCNCWQFIIGFMLA